MINPLSVFVNKITEDFKKLFLKIKDFTKKNLTGRKRDGYNMFTQT